MTPRTGKGAQCPQTSYQNRRRRAALSTTGRAAIAVLGVGGLGVGAAYAHADARLFALEAELQAAVGAMTVAQADFNAAEVRYLAVKPEEPGRLPKPPGYEEQLDSLTIRQLKEMSERQQDFGGVVQEWDEANAARREAWADECDRLRTLHGVQAAEDAYNARISDVDAVAWEICGAPAASLSGLMVKLRLNEIEECACALLESDEPGEEEGARTVLWEALISSIASDVRAMMGAAHV